jgi:hypothetical protein
MDLKAIADGYGAFVRDGVRQLPDFCYTDLRYEHGEDALPCWKLNYEKLQRLKEEEKQSHVTEDNLGDNFEQQEAETKKTETKTDENLGLQIISVLEKSDVSLYGYEIARAIGLSPKEAIRIRQPLRELVKDGKLVIDKLQLRKKEVVYYSIPDTEQFHNLMIKETEKEIIKAKWKIVSRAVHGMHMPDFVIEKNGKIFVECETGRKNSLGDFDKRVSEYESTTMIVSPNLEQKERYSYLVSVNSGKAKVCLIPEIEEVLKNW